MVVTAVVLPRTEQQQLHLGLIFQHLHDQYLQLITSDSSLIEAYQSVDAAGATIRRYAFVDPRSRVEMQPGKQPTSSSTSRHAPHAEAPKLGQAKASAGSSSSERNAASLPHPGFAAGTSAQAELTYLQRRFVASFKHLPGSSAHTNSQQSVSQPQNGHASLPAQGTPPAPPPMDFQLVMQPTDAAWENGELVLRGQLQATYPQTGSWALRICPSSAMGAKQCHVLMKLVEAAHAGQALTHPLRSAVRHLENRAGLLAQVHEQSYFSGACGQS